MGSLSGVYPLQSGRQLYHEQLVTAASGDQSLSFNANPTAASPTPTGSHAPSSPSPTQYSSSPAIGCPTPQVSPLPSKLHTLVGVIELGDGSTAALFKIDGVTQRIGEGEPIGDSGWTMVSAANQNAIVRRNGEVRSVYVGQEF
jgi:hypothetical protein